MLVCSPANDGLAFVVIRIVTLPMSVIDHHGVNAVTGSVAHYLSQGMLGSDNWNYRKKFIV